MRNLVPDLRFALRTMRRTPLFTAVAILSLALGIGANTAIFTLMDQIMLRQLPVRDPDQLVMLYQRGANNGSNMGDRMHSYPIYRDYQQKGSPFSEVLCRRLVNTSISVDNQTERVDAEMVSGNYFNMLGVKPAVGRVLNSKEDDQIYQGHPSVVLSYDYWTSRFAKPANWGVWVRFVKRRIRLAIGAKQIGCYDEPKHPIPLNRGDHSQRRAFIGSTRVARAAGRYPASRATPAMPTVASTIVDGSLGAMP